MGASTFFITICSCSMPLLCMCVNYHNNNKYIGRLSAFDTWIGPNGKYTAGLPGQTKVSERIKYSRKVSGPGPEESRTIPSIPCPGRVKKQMSFFRISSLAPSGSSLGVEGIIRYQKTQDEKCTERRLRRSIRGIKARSFGGCCSDINLNKSPGMHTTPTTNSGDITTGAHTMLKWKTIDCFLKEKIPFSLLFRFYIFPTDFKPPLEATSHWCKIDVPYVDWRPFRGEWASP